MKRGVSLLAALLLAAAAPAMAATEDECTSMWLAADANKDGVLKDTEAERYAAALRIAEKPVPAEGISQTVFMETCAADVFDVAEVEKGAPFEGANSFTEGQAQDRIMAAGFSGVSGLKKDDKGIWRGTATLSGKNVNVAVDYKGNVVAQ